MEHYFSKAQDVLTQVNSSENGITASEVEKRALKDGKNKLAESKNMSLISRFIKQIMDPMIIILIVAAIVSGATSIYSGESLFDVVIILIVVLINAVLGVYQESKAENAIEALQKMAASTTKVVRQGLVSVIKSEDLVVGDVVLLEAGDAVPADGRIIECASLKVEESALTGESVPVNKTDDVLIQAQGKDMPLGDRKNMVYMGSSVAYGRAKAVITSIGMSTEMGKIAHSLSNMKEGKTPLQRKLAQLSLILTYVVIGICVFIFGFNLFTAGDINSAVILDTFMIGVSLAVAAIPEGLATVVTIVLSIGVTNMSKKNAVIRKLTAVETLGCAQIICSDKTGTLTQNKMTVVEHFCEDEKLLATAMSLCSDASLDEKNEAVGEPTECALVNYAYKLKLSKDNMMKESPRVGEAPFDSTRKMMSTIHKTKKELIQYTKGAPDEVLKQCTKLLKNGAVVDMTGEDRANILEQNKIMADKALRVLAAGFKEYSEIPSNLEPEFLEKELVFIGLVGMIDPVRPEVLDAIVECKSAGIRPIMITGDHLNTAVAIAKQLGIISGEEGAITGAMLDEISDEKYKNTIGNYSVYARVKPENKVRIVNTWRENGFICAMTGDGVNDAPSIKNADIGVGMGITGTDVTKNVADMVLADDNFATIVTAVSEGRRIYDNIRKTIRFLLSSNLSEVISIFVATVLGFTILKPVHLLWINLITDTFPALALGMEKADEGIMKRKPRSAKEGIFAGGLGVNIFIDGIIVTLLTLAAYFIGHFMESGRWEIVNSADGITMAFLTMSMAEIFHSFNVRSQRESIFTIKIQNWYLWGTMAASLLLTTLVVSVPFLQTAFGFEPISLTEYAIALVLSISIIPIIELIKLIRRTFDKK